MAPSRHRAGDRGKPKGKNNKERGTTFWGKESVNLSEVQINSHAPEWPEIECDHRFFVSCEVSRLVVLGLDRVHWVSPSEVDSTRRTRKGTQKPYQTERKRQGGGGTHSSMQAQKRQEGKDVMSRGDTSHPVGIAPGQEHSSQTDKEQGQ